MRIEILKCLQDNYSYLIIDETNKNACVVDPGESIPIINFVENNNIKLKYILNTHHHYDHIGGNLELKEKYGSKIVGNVGRPFSSFFFILIILSLSLEFLGSC